MLFEVSAWYSGVWFVAVWRGFVVSVSSGGAVMDKERVALVGRIREYRAERDEALRALAESRARFADSEARRAELEAALAKGREWLDADVLHSHDQWADLFTAPSVVLEDRDREVAARAVEAVANEIGGGGPLFLGLHRRAAAIRKGDTNA